MYCRKLYVESDFQFEQESVSEIYLALETAKLVSLDMNGFKSNGKSATNIRTCFILHFLVFFSFFVF